MGLSISSCSSSLTAVAAQNARRTPWRAEQKSAVPELKLVPLDFLRVVLVVAVPLRVIHQRHQADADDEREANAAKDRDPAPWRNIDGDHLPLVIGNPEDEREQGQERSDRKSSCHMTTLVAPLVNGNCTYHMGWLRQSRNGWAGES